MNESNNKKKQVSAFQDIRVSVFGRTDVGLVREHNEDNFLVADLSEGNRSIRPEAQSRRIGPKGSVFAVCDGMGGAAAGEVASRIAVDTIYDMMQQGEAATDDESLARKLEKAVCEAGRRILTAAKINRSQRGMGTTVTIAALIGPRLLIGQVGDSRAYILRGRRLVQVTKDQSLVQQLIDAKQMTEEEAKTFDKNNIILQALGTSEDVHVDVTSVVLKKGDRLVMCSDGLSGLVENETIREVVSSASHPADACKILTEKACENGGHDNITAIVAAFDGDSLDAPPPLDKADHDLVYNRFTFSRSSETTARKMRPVRPPDHKNSTRPVAAIPTQQKVAPTPKPSAGRPQTLIITAAILAVSIAVIAAVMMRREQNEETSAPVLAPPSGSPKPTAVSSPPSEPFRRSSREEEPPYSPPSKAANAKPGDKEYVSVPKSENRASTEATRDKVERKQDDKKEDRAKSPPVANDETPKVETEEDEKDILEETDAPKTPRTVNETAGSATAQEEVVPGNEKNKEEALKDSKKAPIPDNPFAEE
jgi:serine/threonine protein phosphatase PrpC